MNLRTDDSCPCLSGRDFAACCKPALMLPDLPVGVPVDASRAALSLRAHLIRPWAELPSLQSVFLAMLDRLPPAWIEELETDSTGAKNQAITDLFLWAWFREFSDARPLMRVARALETMDLRLARRLEEWSLSPWEPFEVMENQASGWKVRNMRSGRISLLSPSRREHQVFPGDALVTRRLRHHGHELSGTAFLPFRGEKACELLRTGAASLGSELGLAPGTVLRPDVHTGSWFPWHQGLLMLWWASSGNAPLVPPKRPEPKIGLDRPDQVFGGQTPREAALHAFGRHRIRRFLEREQAAGRLHPELAALLGSQT